MFDRDYLRQYLREEYRVEPARAFAYVDRHYNRVRRLPSARLAARAIMQIETGGAPRHNQKRGAK